MAVAKRAMNGSDNSRLVVIDALRGVAALAVVLHHVFLGYVQQEAYSSVLDPLFWLGSTGVWLFIVISGFCIHLRFAKSLAGGHAAPPAFVAFWKRRLRRLYPAYFAALLIYVALRLVDGSIALDRAFAYDFGMHVFLVQNLDPLTVFGFCGAFWTLALEEHLYLAYFLLLEMRRRLNWPTILGVCLAVRALGLTAHWVLKRYLGWESAFEALFVAQWFVWALGAVSVEAYFGVVSLPQWCRDGRVAAGLLALMGVLISVERQGMFSEFFDRAWWAVRDPALGLGFFVLLNHFVLGNSAGARPPAVLQKGFAALGVFSYSLYLVHQVISLHLGPMALKAFDLSPRSWMAPVVVLGCLGFAKLFFNMFERPFLSPAAKAAL